MVLHDCIIIFGTPFALFFVDLVLGKRHAVCVKVAVFAFASILEVAYRRLSKS